MDVSVVLPLRLDSSRLWGKALLPYAGVPALKLIFERTGSTEWSQILAISGKASSDPIADHARLWDIEFVRGSHSDVLGRVLMAAEAQNADVIVRATGDNPMLDARAVEKGLNIFRGTNSPCVCNLGLDGSDDPVGYFVDIASVDALRKLHSRNPDPRLCEHVTLGLKEEGRCESFSVLSGDQSDVSWTVDEPDQYQQVSRLFAEFGPDVEAEDALKWTKYTST